jgi:hypothetical protein
VIVLCDGLHRRAGGFFVVHIRRFAVENLVLSHS